MAAAKSSAKSASRVSAVSSASIQFDLRVIAGELRGALSTIIVATRALREQNADIDADIALVLQRAAAAPIHSGVERLEGLLTQMNGGSSRPAPEQDCVH